MKNLEAMPIYDILTKHDFPHRFYAYFAAQCAKGALSKVKNVDLRSKTAVDVAERFGNGEDFTQEYLKEVKYAANASYASYAASAASVYASAAFYAAHAASAADASYAAFYAVNAASAADASYATYHCKPLLLSLIKTRLTEFERIMILGS